MELIQAQNGGWIVRQIGSPYEVPVILGAYSNTADALAGLARLMAAKDTPHDH